MKSLLLSIIFILYSFSLSSQELIVKSFQLNEGDLSARIEKRLDSNGNQCALVKVEAIPACEFGGYVIGKVEKKLGAYWVYICAQNPKTRKLIVASDNFQPIEVEFSKFGITSIEAGSTYTLRIESVNHRGITVIGGHKYVEMGLSVYWAECNLGALQSHETGDEYAWGVNFATNDTISMKVKNICGTKYDAVSQLWGNEWRMPTDSELSELLNTCIVYDDSENGVEGKRFIGLTGNTIFIPYTNSSEKGNYTSIWAGNKGLMLRYGRARPYILELKSMSTCFVWPMVSENAECYFRPVISLTKEVDDSLYWGIPTNGRYLIKGQLVYAIGHTPVSRAVNIYDNASGKFIQQIVNGKGLFEIWVTKDQELRFEFDGDPEQKPTIMNARPIMKVNMIRTPTFELG